MMSIAESIVHRAAVSIVGLVIVSFGLSFPVSGLAQALECPVYQRTHTAGVLQETPLQVKEMESFLGSGNSNNHLSEIVADLRKRYPGVENAEIENYLVTAYCPVADKLTGLSRAERQARVDRFAHQASSVIYGR